MAAIDIWRVQVLKNRSSLRSYELHVNETRRVCVGGYIRTPGTLRVTYTTNLKKGGIIIYKKI